MKKKNIVLLSSSDIQGGAAIASFRLFNALKAKNENTSMLVKNKVTDHPGVIAVKEPDENYINFEKIINTARRSFRSMGKHDMGIILTAPLYPGYNILHSKEFKSAEIINIHSVRQFLSVQSLSEILRSKKKVVFTLHDESLYTGGCVYSGGCGNFSVSCSDCPALEGFRTDIPHCLLREKAEKWDTSGLNIIAPSKWIGKQAAKSYLLRDAEIHHVPNGIDVDQFKKTDRNIARKKLGIPEEKTVILTGAMSLELERKGYRLLLDALRELKNKRSLKRSVLSNVVFATFGENRRDDPEPVFPMMNLGNIGSEEKLALIYSAADAFLLPSLEDNLPNTMLESMSCGTPVIAFDTGGISDVIEHQVDGMVAECGNVSLLSDCISDLISDAGKRARMGREARRKIESSYTLKIQADRYLEIFSTFQ